MATPSPYYLDDYVALYLGDARKVLRAIPEASVGLVVSSPPYNAKIKYDGYDDWLPWKAYWHGLIEPVLRECYRVLVPGGRICLNYANMVRLPEEERPRIMAPRMWGLLEAIGFLPREQLTWVKGKHAEESEQTTDSTAWGSWCSAQNPVLRAIVEPVYIAAKGQHSRERGVSDITPEEFKAWTRNAWMISAGHASRTLPHPAMFPEELPRRLIKLFSYTTDTILDPFAGMGTVCRVAKTLGRRSIGIELSEAYCRVAANRCRQDGLFTELGA